MNHFKTRNDMISTFDSGLKIAELGVFKGEFSKDIHNICKPSELYLVDLFSGYFGSGDKDGNNYHRVHLEEELIKLKSHFSNNPEVKIIKSNTTDFLFSLEDNFLDVVYIDADHSYDSVLSDLNNSYNKVKLGGFICGHDYISEAKLAIDDFCLSKNLTIKYLTEDGCPSFCIIKQ